ncbi:MAG TPA: methyltransferase domain-containing protein, partial [Candidatus Methylacidiphilales bacterium]
LEWQRRYEEKDTPWDQGRPAPALVSFLRQHPIIGKVLVPGCVRGHEVRESSRQPQASVVGLDLSPAAIAQAGILQASAGAKGEASFVEGDFFQQPAGWEKSFDWLVEHTCFCAIEPRQRPEYVLAAASALRSGGRIFGIFFIHPDTDSGPPFAVSREELSGLFDPHFTLLEEWVPRESFPGRENRELVRLMQKR